MGTVQELVKRWWSVAALAIVAMLWLKAHDQAVLAKANGRRTADSLEVVLRQRDSIAQAGEIARDSMKRRVRQLELAQAASVRQQAQQQVQTAQLVDQILASVPDSVKAKVQALNESFERERVSFRNQIETSARINAELRQQMATDSATIRDLRDDLREATVGWQNCERRGTGVVTKVFGVVKTALAVKGAFDLVSQ